MDLLVMLAHAFLTVIAAEQPDPPEDAGLILLTRNEIAHLLAIATRSQQHDPEHQRRWSTW